MFLHYENLRFLYDPYPIGAARPALEEGTYKELLDAWPPTEIFHHYAKVGDKYSLSEKFNGQHYRDFVRSRPIWREFHRWIKSDAFIAELMDTLRQHHIDLGYRVRPPLKRLSKRIKQLARGRLSVRPISLSARFEFQMLAADGGHILPHSDNPTKIVTLVVSVLRDGEWDPSFGGGTDVNRPKDMRLVYNRLNHQGRFEDMEVLHTFPFVPNQLVMFVKTFNSWHSVRPMAGVGSKAMRRTLTINIETPK
jgi:hypothetical protein